MMLVWEQRRPSPHCSLSWKWLQGVWYVSREMGPWTTSGSFLQPRVQIGKSGDFHAPQRVTGVAGRPTGPKSGFPFTHMASQWNLVWTGTWDGPHPACLGTKAAQSLALTPEDGGDCKLAELGGGVVLYFLLLMFPSSWGARLEQHFGLSPPLHSQAVTYLLSEFGIKSKTCRPGQCGGVLT